MIDAALALGREGGYEAVQMRDVAAGANVAMGTVYRYFSSKDHLLSAGLLQWVEMLDERLSEEPAVGSTPAQRVVEVLNRSMRVMERQPKLAAALLTALTSSDPAAVECQHEVAELMESIITRAVGDPHPDEMPARARVLGHVWHSCLIGWVNGWPVERVDSELAVAAGLLLALGEHVPARQALC